MARNGKKSDNPKTVKKSIRFTESEWASLDAARKNDGYSSLSRYIRDIVINRKVTINKNIELTDESYRKMINNITAEIKKIGANYNQIAKRYQSSTISKRKDGNPVISTKSTIYYMDALEKQTDILIEQVQQMIEAANAILNKNHS